MTGAELTAVAQSMSDLRRSMRPTFKGPKLVNEFIDAMQAKLEALRVPEPPAPVEEKPEVIVVDAEEPKKRKRKGTDYDRMERGGEDRSE
jgi:hypothetical protein